MKRDRSTLNRNYLFLSFVPAAMLAATLAACGGDGGSDVVVTPSPSPSTLAEAPPATDRTVVGTIDNETAAQPQAVAPGTSLTLDDGSASIPLDAAGRFEIHDVQDGNHSLFIHHADGTAVEVPFRMLEGRSLSLGTLRLGDGSFEHTGFNGFRFGFVDENGDGVNDLFVDADGDGICDNAGLYAGYPYFMGHGFVDADGNGINDRFRDADGNGTNDVDGLPYGHGFGFVDTDGDGIDDVTRMPFRHPFGYADENGDGFNDHFRDSNGDGVNDLTGAPFIAMPGWVDLDNDGVCDFFTDENGDGINDRTGLPYGHGFGWADGNGDGINDRFQDVQGDGLNDRVDGPFAGMPFHIGFGAPHTDADGDGIDDFSGMPYHHGFGWVDLDGDGVNDAFADADGDGINDFTGHHYDDGFMAGPGGGTGGHMEPGDWPMGPHDGGMM